MKIICIGQNYPAHIDEMKSEHPKQPVFFLKPETALIPKQMPFYIPDFSNEIHYEAELVLKISRLGKNISPKFAHTYFSEITIGIDFTARDIQRRCKEKGLPWEIAKAFDGSAPVGNFIQKDQLENSQKIDFFLKKNDVIVQHGNSKNMIFDFNHIISYVSQFITLKIGDLIFTGTPAGVGIVAVNDVITGYIENNKLLELKIK